VYVTGAVVKAQQTVDLPFGSRVEDAVNAVGGLTADADRTSINLARILQDGEHLHVLGAGELASNAANMSTPQALTKPLNNVNTASAAELQALPGCGPAMANAIIAYRVQNGSFRSLDDLDKVDGIGPKTLEAWQGLILFG
jgi:competence protein ComEA